LFLPVLMNVNVTEQLTFFGRIYGLDTNPQMGMWYLFITINLLCILVYVLEFARKIELWQNVVIYIVMFVGCIMLTFFVAFLPMAESLAVAAVVLGIYSFRLHQERKARNIKTSKK